MQKARRRPLKDSDRLWTYGFRVFSLPCLGFLSPFPHGTGSLSVSQEYLALPDGAGIFRQDFTSPALLNSLEKRCRVQGFHLLRPGFPSRFTTFYQA